MSPRTRSSAAHAARRPKRRRRSLAFTTALMVAMSALLVGPSLAGHNGLTGSNFESEDGNLVTDDTASHIDWETVAFQSNDDQSTGSGDNSFGQGASEDTACPAVVSGSIPPNKSDLKTFGLYVEDGSFLHMFWTRVQDPKGTTNMDFEFNQNDPAEAPCSNGVTPVRAAGDALITYNLSKGGTTPSFFLHRWIVTGTNAKAECESSSSFPCWSAGVELAGNDATGSVNTTQIDGIAGVPGPLDAFTFGEGSIDLSTVFPEGDCVNFGSAYLKSRSSDSFTSALKDFIAPLDFELQNCGSLEIVKKDDAGANLADAKFKVYLDDGDGIFEPGADDTQVGSECTTTADGTGTCTFDDLLFGDYWVEETVVPDGYTGEAPKLVTVDQATTFTATFTNSRVPANITVKKVDDADPAQPLAGAEFTLFVDNDPFGPTGQKGAEDTTTGLSCTTGANGECTITGILTTGPHWVVETVVPTNHTGGDDQWVDISLGQEIDLTSTPFVNERIPGSVDILKQDDAGNALQGAVFTLFNDVGTVGTFEEGTDTTTGETCTTDATGTCTIDDVDPGDYCVVETTTPPGHDTAAPQCFSVDLNETVELTFDNERQHKVIVIVCHEGTNDLAASDVVNGGDDLTTIGTAPSFATEAQLCSLDGFDGKPHGDKDLTVDVGSDAHTP